MNTRHLFAAAALALTGVAASASPSVFNDMPSTASRADVMAQVDQARAEGRLFRANDAYGAGESMAPAANLTASTTTREAVLAELMEARRSGEFDVRGEVYGNMAWTQFGNHGQVLPEQAGTVAARASATGEVQASSEPSRASEPMVLWVPLDGEAITLRPGEAVLLMPSAEPVMPEAE